MYGHFSVYFLFIIRPVHISEGKFEIKSYILRVQFFVNQVYVLQLLLGTLPILSVCLDFCHRSWKDFVIRITCAILIVLFPHPENVKGRGMFHSCVLNCFTLCVILLTNGWENCNCKTSLLKWASWILWFDYKYVMHEKKIGIVSMYRYFFG